MPQRSKQMPDQSLTRRTAIGIGAATAATTALPSWAKPSGTVDVLVLGAGMAGLHAARLIEQAGLSVQVIEGSPRIGGRCWTARHLQGRPEYGAQQIGAGYGRVRGNAADLGVELVDPPKGASAETRLPPLAVSIGGGAPTADWATSPMNKLAPDEKALSPLALLSHYLFKANPLVDPEDWQKPDFANIDAQSLRQYLARQGASPEALRLMNVSIAARDLNDANALDFLRKQYYYAWEGKHGGFQIVRDGTDALTTAMAASLKRNVLLNRIVTHIDARRDGVSVTCRDGSTYRARKAISTIPPTVLKTIPITGAVPPAQRAGWNRQRSVGLCQVYLKTKSRFWEKDGLPATLWTDGPYEVFIHAPSLVDESGILYAYINGAGAEALSALDAKIAGEKIVAELVRLRPSAAGQVEVAQIHNWATYPFSKGHIAYFQPGDIKRYADIVGHPVGALHFAGEHLCRVHAGIEGACETGENAALAVLEALGKA